jgi:hypothetical protein
VDVMNAFQVLYAIVVSFITLFLVITLIRTQILRINYSILWLAGSIVIMLFIVKYDWVVRLDDYLDLGGPKNVFFFVTIFFLLAMCVQFSIIISNLVLRVKNLAQKIALLEYEQTNGQ